MSKNNILEDADEQMIGEDGEAGDLQEAPEGFNERVEKNCENVSEWMTSIINPMRREVYANKPLMKQIKAFKNGEFGENPDPDLAQFVTKYQKINKFGTMCNNPARYHNKAGYPQGGVNLLSNKQTNESVVKKHGISENVKDELQKRIADESEELNSLITINKVKPPYPRVEKKGKIINNLPAGMNNPNCGKDKSCSSSNPFGAGRPSKVDSDMHVNSWDRDRLVNTHMSKVKKAEKSAKEGL